MGRLFPTLKESLVSSSLILQPDGATSPTVLSVFGMVLLAILLAPLNLALHRPPLGLDLVRWQRPQLATTPRHIPQRKPLLVQGVRRLLLSILLPCSEEPQQAVGTIPQWSRPPPSQSRPLKRPPRAPEILGILQSLLRRKPLGVALLRLNQAEQVAAMSFTTLQSGPWLYLGHLDSSYVGCDGLYCWYCCMPIYGLLRTFISPLEDYSGQLRLEHEA